jgi:short-subunit dehydrogenase
MNNIVLITGASTGIGKATALLLDKQGYIVFAGVRKPQDGDALKHGSGTKLQPIILDVANAEHIARSAEILVKAGNGGLFAVINNAGYNYIDPFEFTDEAQARAQMEVNFFGLYKLSQTLIPLLRVQAQTDGAAHIVNVGSVGSTIGLPWQSFYHASKFAMLGLSESMRLELASQRIHVTAVLPGGIKTPFFQKSSDSAKASLEKLPTASRSRYEKGLNFYQNLGPAVEKFASPPEKVAQSIAKILASNKPSFKHYVGTDANIMKLMIRYFPASWVHKIASSQFGL